MRLVHICFLLLFSGALMAQKKAVFTERTAEFERGLSLYDQGIYGAAYSAFERSARMDESNNDPKVDLLSAKSQLMMGKSSVRIGKPDAEAVMLSYFRKNVPDALAYEAVMDLGNYYYSKKNYDDAIAFYTMIDPTTLSDEQKSEIRFKQGYAQFVKKKYRDAQRSFGDVRNIKNKYYEQANYYYGLSAYYNGDYDNAVAAFKVLTTSKKYKSVVPVNICQILLSQKKYDELLAFAEPLLSDESIKKQPELRQMIGQAYLGKGDYEKALPYLEEYAQSGAKQSPDDYFQLGVAQYKAKEYSKAIVSFRIPGEENSETGMYAMFYTADSYLKLDDKNAARNAFLKASGKNFDKAITEEALFNYAKLSVELGYEKEALKVLQQIKQDSRYYAQAQELISDVLINTNDYEKALTLLDAIPNKSAKMTETYQKVLFYRGIQLHAQKSWDACQPLFKKALVTGPDSQIKALSHFFLGDAAYNKGDMTTSRSELKTFIAMAEGINTLPPQTSIPTAQYDLGYISLGESNYKEALGYFEKAIAGFKTSRMQSDSYISGRLLPDATLRAGDCYLKNNNYTKAKEYYNIAINNRYPHFVYALYQSAVISGLQGDRNGKIAGLRDISDKYRDSEYADDALLELANSYYTMNMMPEGIAVLKRLVKDYKSKSDLINKALLKMGLMYYNSGDYTNALSNYKEVVRNNPTKEEADAALSAIKEIYVNDLKKPDEYFAYAETIPGYKATTDEKEKANFQVAEDYYEDGKYAEAIQAYDEYLRKYPKGARIMDAVYHRGESYAAQKKYSEALTDYKAVIAMGSSVYYKDALEKSAIISYNYSNNFEDAYSYYTTWANIETKEDKRFEAQLGALRSAYRTGKKDEVIRLADLVTSSSRASVDQKTSAHFYRAKAAQDLKDYTRAISSYNEVIRNTENEQAAESRYRIAEIYYLNNDKESAEVMAQDAMEANGDYPYWVAKSLILTADILTDKGDYINARAALEAVIENFPDDKEISAEAKRKLEQVKKK